MQTDPSLAEVVEAEYVLTELSSLEDIESRSRSVQDEIAEIKLEMGQILGPEGDDDCVWENVGLLRDLSLQGLEWNSTVELELLLRSLSKRNRELSTYLSMSKEETAQNVNEIHQSVNLCEHIDSAWMEELELRHQVDEQSHRLSVSASKLKEQDDEILQIADDEVQLTTVRKQHMTDIAVESQSILKNRSMFEDVSHHLNTFQAGLEFINPSLAKSVPEIALQSLAEQMRCAYSELRRVNASLEAKLVMTGISKQKIMDDVRTVLIDIRASCSRNPAKFRLLNEEVLDDPNLSSHTIRDINAVWKACVPVVPCSSNEQTHSDLLTWLSVSMGHFAHESVDETADVIITNNLKSMLVSSSFALTSHLEEESRLVGVLTLETHRYRSIAAALKCAIRDSQILLEKSEKVDHSVSDVICRACDLMRDRLGCRAVSLWRKLSDDTVGGYCSKPADQESPRTVSLSIRDIPKDAFPLFARSVSRTIAIEGLRLNDLPSLPMDIQMLVQSGVLSSGDTENETFDMFGVRSDSPAISGNTDYPDISGRSTSTDQSSSMADTPDAFGEGGLSIVRGSDDVPFHSFSAIYCEQFYRRILAAITPLQQTQAKRAANQRPLDLVDCMFELRSKANCPSATMELASRHLKSLFDAENLSIDIVCEANVSQCVHLASSSTGVARTSDATTLKGYIDLKPAVMDTVEKALNGVSLISTSEAMMEIIRNGGSISPRPDSAKSGAADDESPNAQPASTVVWPVMHGRSVVMIVTWENFVCGGSSTQTELRFDPSNHGHTTTLTTYISLLQSLLATWFSRTNGSLSPGSELKSYGVEDDIENKLIDRLVRGHSSS